MKGIRQKNQSPFPMDQGIDKIFRSDPVVVESGPIADISPAFSAVKPRLDQLFAMPNLEDYISSVLAPQINEPSLMLPNRFNNALRAAMEELEAASEEDPRNGRILQRARRLLDDQVSLRDLVHMYRQALLKG
ncbi:MAG: hypothetical protein EOO28_16450 [Comamonadaceae bacterium]|nr:MAG: hypothetical protein EOO28_16450 [Comamonadaceae bacterium]